MPKVDKLDPKNYKNIDKIIQLSQGIKQKAIKIEHLDKWQLRFPMCKKFISQLPSALHRKNVAQIVREQIINNQYLNAYVVVCIWGQGNMGAGAYRSSQILNNGHYKEFLKVTADLIIANKYLDAFDLYKLKRLKGLNLAFMSKYWYFVSFYNKEKLLILDKVISEYLSKQNYGTFRPSGTNKDNYFAYLDLMKKFANNYGFSPDKIEELIFVHVNNNWGQ